MENEISFKAIAEVQADHKLALFCHLGLRSRLITVLPPLSPWTVDSAQGGMRCRSYNSGSFCHRRLKTDRWFPQVHPRPYSKTQGFRITKGDSFLLYYIFFAVGLFVPVFRGLLCALQTFTTSWKTQFCSATSCPQCTKSKMVQDMWGLLFTSIFPGILLIVSKL